MKWSDSTTTLFLEEYLKHECLFNSKSANYRNKLARDAALIKICEVISINGFGVKEALSKIKSIRSTYSQEIKKKINESTKSGAGTDEIYIPTLKWFTLYHEVMKEKDLTPRESQCNLPFTAENETVALASSSQDVPNTGGTDVKEKIVYSRKRNIKCLDNLVTKVKAVGEMVQNPNNMNEFDIFGKSVGKQLNAMPLILALQAQSHIQNYLTTLRIQSLVNPSNIDAYSPSPPASTTYISTPSPAAVPASFDFDNNDCANKMYQEDDAYKEQSEEH